MYGKLIKISLSGTEALCQFPPRKVRLPKKDWLMEFPDLLSLHIYTERYVNKGAYHSFRHFSEVAKKYRPLDGLESFELPYFLLPEEEVEIYQSKLELTTNIWIHNFPSSVPFFAHPDMLATYRNLGSNKILKSKIAGTFTAIPTASTRTLLIVADGNCFMVKVDMSGKRLGRLTRHLGKKSVKRSQIIHDLIQSIPLNQLPPTFAYFPECIGTVTNEDQVDLGNIYREYTAFPISNNCHRIIPLFSLYSPDFKNPGNELIIEQLIKCSGLNPVGFFENKIVQPYIYNAFYMAFKFGLLFEPHPQNVLVELDQNYHITRFIYRDLQTVIVDAEVRNEKGFVDNLPPETKLIAAWQDGLTRQLEYSSFYDHRMAYQSLEEVILAIAIKYPASLAELESVVKKVFWEVIDDLKVDANKFFPKDTYYLYKDGIMTNNIMEPVPFINPPYR